jgi:dTDP-4-dehydrorhamnose reductase
MNVMMLGTSGFLGSYLYKKLKKNKKVTTCGRSKKSDIILKNFNKDNFSKIIQKIKPDIIINLIACTEVDFCEQNKGEANKINNTLVKNLTQGIVKAGMVSKIFFLQISTDQVYNGKGPHKEGKTDPKNIYAKTKLEGEKYIKKINGCVLRTNFVGKSLNKKKNRWGFTDWIFHSLKKKKPIHVFKNVKFSPLNIESLCEYINLIINKKIPGIFNLGSKNGFSKAEFALKFAKKLNLNTKLLKFVEYKKGMLFATRPLDMRMNSKSFENKFKVVLKDLNYEINLTSKKYK